MSDKISLGNVAGRVSVDQNSEPENVNTGVISEQSRLHGEVKHASKGASRFFHHPVTVAIFSLLTAGIYGISLAIHDYRHNKAADRAISADVKTSSDKAAGAEEKDAPEKISLKKLTAESTQIPKITSKKQLISYLKLCCDPKHTVNGTSVQTGTVVDDQGNNAKIFKFKGIVFRGDGRPPKEILKVGGFHSRNDLKDPINRQEAMGLGEGKGATGHSGVSCADTFTGALGYTFASSPDEHIDSGRLYIIDSTKLDPDDEPYYMKDIVLKNGYKEEDSTGGEVNVSHIPSKAIIGWIKFDYYTPTIYSTDNPKEQKYAMKELFLDSDGNRHQFIHVEFNSRYKP